MRSRDPRLEQRVISYWQVGCNDAKAGRKLNERMRYAAGYENGYYFGEASRKAAPDPALPNPYMEGIEAIEGILQRLQTFTKEFPAAIDRTQKDQYSMDLLEARDALHRFRQAEMRG